MLCTNKLRSCNDLKDVEALLNPRDSTIMHYVILLICTCNGVVLTAAQFSLYITIASVNDRGAQIEFVFTSNYYR